MKKQSSGILFYIVAGCLLIWTSRLTLSLLSGLLPNIPLAGVFGLVLYDMGLMAWLLIYLHSAEGNSQRLVSLGMTLFSLVGVGLVSLSEIWLNGQTFLTIPAAIPTIALYIVVISTVVNLSAVVLYHILSPASQKAIREQNLKDKLAKEAGLTFEDNIREVAGVISAGMATQYTKEFLDELGNVNDGQKFDFEAVNTVTVEPKSQNGSEPQKAEKVEQDFLSSRTDGGK